MKKIIFATHNSGKIIEMREMLSGLDFEIVSAADVGIFEEPEENGKTFEENARLKARFVANKTKEWSVADDSGVMIDALGGEPGVLTARWAGEGAGADTMVKYTLERMKDVSEGMRQATFHSVVAIVSPQGEEWIFDGEVAGEFVTIPRGTPRLKLPYDVLFQPLGHDRTFAQMSDEEKNTLSHRGQAFGKLKEFLVDRINS